MRKAHGSHLQDLSNDVSDAFVHSLCSSQHDSCTNLCFKAMTSQVWRGTIDGSGIDYLGVGI